MSPPRSIVIVTHTIPEETSDAVRKVVVAARDAGIEVFLPPEELEKHSLGPDDGVSGADTASAEAEATVVLGGDGTILGALRDSAAHGAPVFAFNFGAIGFSRPWTTVSSSRDRAPHRGRLRGPGDARAVGGRRRCEADRRQRHLVPPPRGRASR